MLPSTTEPSAFHECLIFTFQGICPFHSGSSRACGRDDCRRICCRVHIAGRDKRWGGGPTQKNFLDEKAYIRYKSLWSTGESPALTGTKPHRALPCSHRVTMQYRDRWQRRKNRSREHVMLQNCKHLDKGKGSRKRKKRMNMRIISAKLIKTQLNSKWIGRYARSKSPPMKFY